MSGVEPYFTFPCRLGRDETLSPAARAVLYALLSYANEDGCCYPAKVTLRRLTGWGSKKVKAAIAELKKRGVLDAPKDPKRMKNGRFEKTLYRVMRDKIGPLPRGKNDHTAETTMRQDGRDGENGRPVPTPEVDTTGKHGTGNKPIREKKF